MKYLDWLLMSKEKSMVPELRFPEFEKEVPWVQKKLGDKDVSYLVTEKTNRKSLDLNNYISTENMLPGYAGICAASKLPSTKKVTEFIEGDLLISNIRPYLKKVWRSNMIGGASNDILVFRSGSKVSSDFLEFLLKNDRFIKYVMQSAKGVKMPRGDKDSIQEYKVLIPSKSEQQKIADCLSSLDALIAAHRDKLDALRAHKKGLMQNLFPQEGETVPRYRFAGFEGAWEEKKLGEMTTKVGSGKTPKGGDKNYVSSGRPFVRSQNIGWGILLLEDIAFINEETHSTFLSSEIELNDVLLNITGASIGRSVIANEKIVKGNVNQHVCIIRTKNALNPVFLNQYLISQYGQRQIDSFQAGGNRQGLNFSQIRSLVIPTPPTKKEQQKIADCLASFDEVIVAQEDRIAQLQEHKRGLMQGLFPKTNG
ncbi:restriction endonuclease subunit S [Phaeodactylibacter xiamenensis]|uniref:restriction endonuclease subunit S n=1 Tax=Phaeodactylibacter xiamenensis TaxID=1524460 RepID=UPI003CCC36C6